jgi:hypothetical protein
MDPVPLTDSATHSAEAGTITRSLRSRAHVRRFAGAPFSHTVSIISERRGP